MFQKTDIHDKTEGLLIGKRVISLTVIQLLNYAFPFVTLPFLLRTVGPDVFGTVAFYQYLSICFNIFIDFGFNWSASRDISKTQNKEQISLIASNTMLAQFFIFLFSIPIFISMYFLLNEKLQNPEIAFSSLFLIVGNLFSPQWLFQGLQRQTSAALIQLIVRIFSIIPILIIVRGPEHGEWISIINGMAMGIGGVIVISNLYRQRLFDLLRPNLAFTLSALKSNGTLMTGRLAISTYAYAVPLLLGVYAGPAELALYNIADKIRQVAQFPFQALSQTLFPRVNRLLVENKQEARHMIIQTGKIIFFAGAACSFIIWLAAEKIVLLLGGTDYQQASSILRLLSPLPLILALSSHASLHILIANGKQKTYTYICISALLVAVLFLSTIGLQSASDAAHLILFVELSVLAAASLAGHRVLQSYDT